MFEIENDMRIAWTTFDNSLLIEDNDNTMIIITRYL